MLLLLLTACVLSLTPEEHRSCDPRGGWRSPDGTEVLIGCEAPEGWTPLSDDPLGDTGLEDTGLADTGAR
ncbi:MAG: hypothetical protein JXX28_00470 [Deltaproteobacteria bacterium]|nr:hypothetical protein [Deltaproteobacteria bacterium]